MSYRTEETYADWIKRYIIFHNKRHPKELGASEIRDFLAHLVIDCNVAASTQNQALHSIPALKNQVAESRLREWTSEKAAALTGKQPHSALIADSCGA